MRRQLYTRTQLSDPSLALEPHSQYLQSLYSVDEAGLLCRGSRVLVLEQKSLSVVSCWSYITAVPLEAAGFVTTLDLLQRRFTWTGISQDVAEYVATCQIY